MYTSLGMEAKTTGVSTSAIKDRGSLYWLVCGLACTVIALGAALTYSDKIAPMIAFVEFAGLSLLIWLIGRAYRSVVSGRSVPGPAR
jgi:hypothetical protein